MVRSRLTSRVGRWGLLLVLATGSGHAVHAQPAIETMRVTQPAVSAPVPGVAVAPAVGAPAASWPWVLALLGGFALGVLSARLWARKSAVQVAAPVVTTAAPVATTAAPVVAAATRLAPPPVTAKPKRAENVPKMPAENVVKPPTIQSLREAQRRPDPLVAPAILPQTPDVGGSSKQNTKKNSVSRQSQPWPANVPHRPSAMDPTQSPVPPTPADQPLETGQTIEWAASTPPTEEVIVASTPDAPAIQPAVPATGPAAETAAAIVATGPVHYYAPAPDVPSIEHRKLSPNPLPQMPLLITLPHAEATTAQYSFSPQADQSRIIGNGVRELKEFFAFELPPTEQFTTITNLAAGKLEKREDAWHVVQKAEIALS